jgi:rubrerythrin
MCKSESENETMTKAMKPTTGFKSCSICKHIPDHKFAETLHTDARLPTQVDQLEILGGYGIHGYEQVRKCPLCKTYYTYLYDHDSESGVGIGWTDEEIQRITPESALKVMERVLTDSQSILEQCTKEFQKTQDSHAQQAITRHSQEVNRLIQELASLKKILSLGE